MICKKVEFMKEITCAGRFFLSGKGGKKNAWYIYFTSGLPPPNLGICQHLSYHVKFYLKFKQFNYFFRQLACVTWLFWLGAQSNKGERGQRNREEIETGATIFLADSLLIREGTFFIVGGWAGVF